MRRVQRVITSFVPRRVVSVSVRCIECDIPIYEPLDVNKTYRVLTQDYIGEGGGGYTMLSDNRENVAQLAVDYVMLQDYVRSKGTVFADLDGRIEIVW